MSRSLSGVGEKPEGFSLGDETGRRGLGEEKAPKEKAKIVTRGPDCCLLSCTCLGCLPRGSRVIASLVYRGRWARLP